MTEESHDQDELELPPPPPLEGRDRGWMNDNGDGDDADSLGEDFVQLDEILPDGGGYENDNGEEDEDDDDDEEEEEEGDGNDGVRGNNNNNSNDDDDNYRGSNLPPWMMSPVDYRRVNPLVALHNEVVSFCRLMEPREDETKQRQEVVDRFTVLAQSIFEGCQVEVFGSQATGLCLPSSDIDIAIQLPDDNGGDKTRKGQADLDDKKKKPGLNGTNQAATTTTTTTTTTAATVAAKKAEKQQEMEDMENWSSQPSGTPLQRLGAALRSDWIDELSYLEIIEQTRVPLVKFTHAPTGISVDICFSQATGPQAASLMHSYMRALPPLRPLTFVLKAFLASRGLNQPYTGGIGSFLLQMMIVAFLQQRERDSLNSRRPSLLNLGALLVEFLEFYSTDFNFILTGISVRYDGFFFPKGATDRKIDFWMPNRPFSLAMENPLEPTMDVGSASFRMNTIQRSFEIAFKVLLSHVSEPMMPTVSILESILPVTDEMKGRNHNSSTIEHQGKTVDDVLEPPRKRQRRK